MGKHLLYGSLTVFYIVLLGYEISQRKYNKALYWAGVIIINIGIWRM